MLWLHGHAIKEKYTATTWWNYWNPPQEILNNMHLTLSFSIGFLNMFCQTTSHRISISCWNYILIHSLLNVTTPGSSCGLPYYRTWSPPNTYAHTHIHTTRSNWTTQLNHTEQNIVSKTITNMGAAICIQGELLCVNFTSREVTPPGWDYSSTNWPNKYQTLIYINITIH